MDHKYERDSGSTGLVNRDAEGLAAYRKQRDQSAKLEALESDINTLKERLSEIQALLQRHSNKGNLCQ